MEVKNDETQRRTEPNQNRVRKAWRDDSNRYADVCGEPGEFRSVYGSDESRNEDIQRWGEHMTPEEKIEELVAYIKKELPKGCEGVQCKNCPLYRFTDDQSTIEYDICELLSGL